MLLDKLTAEKSHIVEWALEGLEELLENNLIFTESDEACVFKSRYIAELNNVTEFVRDRCCIDLDNGVQGSSQSSLPSLQAILSG